MYNEKPRKPTKTEKERQLMYREINVGINAELMEERLELKEQSAIIGCIRVLADTLINRNKVNKKLDLFEE